MRIKQLITIWYRFVGRSYKFGNNLHKKQYVYGRSQLVWLMNLMKCLHYLNSYYSKLYFYGKEGDWFHSIEVGEEKNFYMHNNERLQ